MPFRHFRFIVPVGIAATVVSLSRPAAASISGSTDVGGYVVTGPVAPAAAVASRIVSVPTPDCVDLPDSNVPIGVELQSPPPVVHLGVTVYATCAGTDPVSYAVVDIGGQQAGSSLIVSPGDKVALSAAIGPQTGESVSITNVTTGITESRTVGYYIGPVAWTATYGVFGASARISQFTRIEWSRVTFNGQPIGGFAPQAYNLLGLRGANPVLVHTTPLSPAGRYFKTTWVRNH
jgi:hypothetical protein